MILHFNYIYKYKLNNKNLRYKLKNVAELQCSKMLMNLLVIAPVFSYISGWFSSYIISNLFITVFLINFLRF